MKHKKLILLSILSIFISGKILTSLISFEQTSRLVINEIQSANIDQFMDPSFNFGGWIELYNPDTKPSSLRGLYISDDSTQLKKSKLINEKNELAPKDYVVYWFGRNIDTPSQISFNLDVDGGTLYISNEDGKILLTHKYPKGISRASYARKKDGGDEWEYTAAPTPGSTNNKAEYTSVRLDKPVIDTDSRLFQEPFDIKVNIPQGTTLRYTLDGTVPTSSNGKEDTTGIFSISKTTILRCRLFAEGKLPSPIATRSYIYETRNFDLPIISVVTDSMYLYDDRIGIYVKGTNGKPGNGREDSCNWNMDWARPANIEYLTQEGKIAVNQEATFCISGGWSRREHPKSFKIKARKKYDGNNFIPYSVFESKPYIKHKTWQVRNGGGKKNGMIKDASLQEIILSSNIDIDAQACQPVAHYINGKYIGLLNIREPNNKDFAFSNFGWKDDEIDHFSIIRYGYQQTRGTDEAFQLWYNLSSQAESPEIYNQIINLVDIDEFINYMAVQMYLGCWDYAKNNTKAFRPRIFNGRFRFMLHDLDSGMSLDDPFKYFRKKRSYNFKIYGTDKTVTKEIKFITIFFNMLKNEKFRKQFIDTYSLVVGSIFEDTRCKEIIDSMIQQREQTFAYEEKTSAAVGYKTKQRLRGRQNRMINVLKNKEYMKLKGVSNIDMKLSSNINVGNLSINNLLIPTNKFNGTVFLPITLQANTPVGFRFVGWKHTESLPQDTIFAYNSKWKYYDGGSLDQIEWKQPCSKIIWQESCAPLGYNNNCNESINTILKSKTDSLDYCNTYYFQKAFKITSDSAAVENYVLSYAFNNGIAIYINGTELIREKISHEEINYKSSAFFAKENIETLKCLIPPSMLQKGENVIAVELHKINKSLPNVYFNAQLVAEKAVQKRNERIISTEEEYTIDNSLCNSSLNLTACFEPLSQSEKDNLITPIVINEISASNSIYVNNNFKKNDWIELYNTTSETIDLAGMYISNNKKDPHKYQIKKSKNPYDTSILPYSYKIIWADKKKSLHEIHTNFKLDKNGGEIILTAADNSWNDCLKYNAHSDKHSVGRYPDGSNQVFVMTKPSIAKSNRINSYDEICHPQKADSNQYDKQQISYTNKQLIVKTTPNTDYLLVVYNLTGRLVMQKQLSGQKGVILNDLLPGIYKAQITNAQGKEQTIRFTIVP